MPAYTSAKCTQCQGSDQFNVKVGLIEIPHQLQCSFPLVSPCRDLTRQLRQERGVKLSPVDDPHDISHEALCALSQDQIYSLMTSNSVNYDIIHHIMQLKKMAEEEGTKVRGRG